MATKQKIEEKEYLKGRLAKVSAISSVAESEGGGILVRELLKDVLGIVETFSAKHRDLRLEEFVALSAEMKSKLDLAQVIAHSKKTESQIRQELADLMVEIGEEE